MIWCRHQDRRLTVLARFRRAAIIAAPAVLLAGAIGLVTSTAQAGSTSTSVARTQTQQCSTAQKSRPACSFDEQIQLPLSMQVTAAASPAEGQQATVSWQISCSVNGNDSKTSSGNSVKTTPFHLTLALPKSENGGCTVDANISLSGTASLKANLVYSTGTQVAVWIPTGDTRPGAPLATLMCMDDASYGGAPGAEAVLESCSYIYASAWTYSGDHLIHHGLCLTDPGNGGSGTKMRLERCTRSADQKWLAIRGKKGNPSLQLAAHGGAYCLDDPKLSGRTGTALTVYGCNGSNEQFWSFS
jgi:hypothetical protein